MTKLLIFSVFISIALLGQSPRSFDDEVKLVNYSHSEKKGDNHTTGPDKIFTRKCNKKTHEVMIIFNESCGLEFHPKVMFANDTLFIVSSENDYKNLVWSNCNYLTTIVVSGLKKTKYVITLDGQTVTEKE